MSTFIEPFSGPFDPGFSGTGTRGARPLDAAARLEPRPADWAEELANTVTHAVGMVLSLAGLVRPG